MQSMKHELVFGDIKLESFIRGSLSYETRIGVWRHQIGKLHSWLS